MKTSSARNFGLGILVAMALGACDGGDDSQPPSTTSSISGVAAAGSPIIGTVTLRDSSSPYQEKSVTIAADGTYKIDTTGLKAPFVLRASGTTSGGKTYRLYSGAVSSDANGNINITPFTDLIIANIAGSVAENYFNNAAFSGLTAAQLTAKEAELHTRLQPILTALGVTASLDLLRTAFAANHTGLDAVLDTVRVTVDPAANTAEILNVINNQRIIDDFARTDTSPIDALNTNASTLSDLQAIRARFDALSALFATGLPALNNATLLGLVDVAGFVDDGNDFNGTFSGLTTSPASIGVKFNDVTLLSQSATAAVAEFSYAPGGIPQSRQVSRMVKVGGVWLLQGNGRLLSINPLAKAFYSQNAGNSNGNKPLAAGSIGTGLRFQIEDQGAKGFSYVVIKGKGLPAAGLLAVRFQGGDVFYLASPPYVGTGATLPSSSTIDGFNTYALSDAVIATLDDNESYTFDVYKDNGTPLNTADDIKVVTYTQAITKRPYPSTSLTAASFASFTTTPAAIGAFARGSGGPSLTAAWTLPAMVASTRFNFHRFGNSVGANENIETNLLPTATTAVTSALSPTFVVTNSAIQVNTVDSFFRILSTIEFGS